MIVVIILIPAQPRASEKTELIQYLQVHGYV